MSVTRARLRTVLVLAGLLPSLLVLGYVLKVVLMVSHDRDGRAAFEDGDHAAAAGEFAANDTLNWFQPWIAAFDEGASLHADGDLDGAVDRYTAALEDVPEREECTVRINLALAHEARGDAALENGDPETAIAEWQAGIEALAAGGCPQDSGRGETQTADAAEVDRRLREKVQQQQQEQQQQPQQPPQRPQQPPQDDEQTPQEQELERRNRQGQEERQQYEDDYGDNDYQGEYEW